MEQTEQTDALITLREAANRLGMTYSPVHSWATKGWRGIVLRTVSAGRNWRTTQSWVDEFTAECSALRAADRASAENADGQPHGIDEVPR